MTLSAPPSPPRAGGRFPRSRRSYFARIASTLTLGAALGCTVVGHSPDPAAAESMPAGTSVSSVTVTRSGDPQESIARFPGAGNTGVPPGVQLRSSGPITVTQPGTVLQNLSIRGRVLVDAPGVVIRNCLFTGTGDSYGLYVDSGDVTISDSTITGNYTAAAVGGQHYDAYRLEVTDMPSDGFIGETDTSVHDSWIHDFDPAPGSHADGIQIQAGVRDVVLEGNNITGASNAAIFIAPDLGPSSPGPVLVDGNLLGDGNYTLYVVDGSDGDYFIDDITVTNNRFFDTARYGPVRVNVDTTWRNNLMVGTREPVVP